MQEMNPFAHLGLSLPSRSSRSSLTPSQFRRFQFYYPILDCIGSAFNVKGIMECPNCREIENGKWRYYVSCSPDHELDLSEDEMDYEDSPIEFLDMVQSLSRMIIMDENGKQARVRETGASSSRSTTGEVNALKEEVTTLKAQLAAQGEQMSIIVRALQMSGL
ncbi:hypothetical protein DVH24_025729 [Malus domestica]|uniref:Uncharacterized protein n=1 Tax=Malus domestica TaxID=3750 RepID=A0A498KMQ8_MALDO|nr:hypothetical protein DVH24_025729 [Malus domestica]